MKNMTRLALLVGCLWFSVSSTAWAELIRVTVEGEAGGIRPNTGYEGPLPDTSGGHTRMRTSYVIDTSLFEPGQPEEDGGSYFGVIKSMRVTIGRSHYNFSQQSEFCQPRCDGSIHVSPSASLEQFGNAYSAWFIYGNYEDPTSHHYAIVGFYTPEYADDTDSPFWGGAITPPTDFPYTNAHQLIDLGGPGDEFDLIGSIDTIRVTHLPEPSPLAALLLGLALLPIVRRRKSVGDPRK